MHKHSVLLMFFCLGLAPLAYAQAQPPAAASQPAASQPAASQPAAVQPAASQPTAAQPAAAQAAPQQCSLQLCGTYLKDGPTPTCRCYGREAGCCRFKQGCSCSRGCEQFGDCCPGYEGVCDGPVVTRIEPAEIPAEGGLITLKGASLGGAWVVVRLDQTDCVVKKVRSRELICLAPASSAKSQTLSVMVEGHPSKPIEIKRTAGSQPSK